LKPGLLDHLVCLRCEGTLTCETRRADGLEVLEGELRCTRCAAAYPIRGGVPRLLPEGLSAPERATSRAFGEQWKILANVSAHARAEFQSYLDPLPAADLAGLTVLDAGCGSGKLAFAACEAGARALIGVDLSDAVDVAWARLRDVPNAHVVQASIEHLPFRAATFDFAYSIGVLHHTPDPESAFRRIVPLVRSGGRVFVWVYAREGNEQFVRWLDPWRARVFSRLPSAANRLAATALAAPLWGVIRGVYVPLARRGRADHLPYSEYFLYFSRMGFGTFWGTVYDKLVPPVSFYLSRDELRGWLRAAGLVEIVLKHRNRNSWSCLARKELSA
jgi:SAM-dependent methyltransferase